MICLQALLMDPSLVPPLRPVTAAIDDTRPVCHVNMTVLDGMNLLSVQDMAVQLVAV